MIEKALMRSGSQVIVLGAGIAGLAAADTLSRQGHHVTVIDRAATAGGTHRSRQIGPYTFDVGSIFYEESAPLLDLAPGMRALCPAVTRVQRRITPNGTVLHYPIEPRELLRRPLPELAKALADLLWSRITVRRDGTLDAISRKRLGGTLFSATGLEHYIARFHHVPPSEIDESFFFRRMAFIERRTRLSALTAAIWNALVMRQAVNARTRRPLRVRPREGYDALFALIVTRLRRDGVRFAFGEELTALRREAGRYWVDTPEATRGADTVISTVPIDTLHRTMFQTESGLTSLDMTTLFVSAGRLAPAAGNVLFNFAAAGRWKRATIYSRIYPEPRTQREFFAVEATIPPGGAHDPQATFDDFRTHVEALGLADDLVLEGYEYVEKAYPLYRPGWGAMIDQAIARITSEGVILAGRQGRFEYLPTSTGVIRRVAEELDAAWRAMPTPNAGA